jgi:hypothetical protein
MKQAFLIIVFLCISYQSYAIDCPPSSTCTATWTTETYGMRLNDNSTIWASATLSHRVNCDGNLEMKIENFDGFSGNDNVNFLDEFNYLHYSFSSASEMIAIDFLMNSDAWGKDQRTLPNCTSGNSLKRVFVYTAACGIWIKCSYKLPNPIIKDCDTGWLGGDPHYGVPNEGPPPTTDQWVDHWKWQSCGEVCCKKEFEICEEDYIDKGGSYVKIKAMTKGKYSEDAQCSKHDHFTGPRPFPTSDTVTLECEDGC